MYCKKKMLSYSNIPILFSLKGFDENYMWILFIIKHWTFDRTSYQNNLTDLFSSVGYLYYLASELTYTLVSPPPVTYYVYLLLHNR